MPERPLTQLGPAKKPVVDISLSCAVQGAKKKKTLLLAVCVFDGMLFIKKLAPGREALGASPRKVSSPSFFAFPSVHASVCLLSVKHHLPQMPILEGQGGLGLGLGGGDGTGPRAIESDAQTHDDPLADLAV